MFDALTEKLQSALGAIGHEAEDHLEEKDGGRGRPRLRRGGGRVLDRERCLVECESGEDFRQPVAEVRRRLDHRLQDPGGIG